MIITKPAKKATALDFLWAARSYAADTITEKVILFYLISCLDSDGSTHPSQTTMMYHLDLDDRTIERGIAVLKRKGIIVVTKVGRSNTYRPVLAEIKAQQMAKPPASEPEIRTKSPGLRVGKGTPEQHPSPVSGIEAKNTRQQRRVSPAGDGSDHAHKSLKSSETVPDTRHQRGGKNKGMVDQELISNKNVTSGYGYNDGKPFSDSIPDLASPSLDRVDPNSNDEVLLTSESSPVAPDGYEVVCMDCGEPAVENTDVCQYCGGAYGEAGALMDERTFMETVHGLANPQRLKVYEHATLQQKRWLLKSDCADEAKKVFQRDKAGQRGDDFLPAEDSDDAHRPLVCSYCNMLKNSTNSCDGCLHHGAGRNAYGNWVPMVKPSLSRADAERQYERQLYGVKDDEGFIGDMEPNALVCTRCNRVGAFRDGSKTCCSSGDDNVDCGGLGLSAEQWLDNIGALWVAWDRYVALCAVSDLKDLVGHLDVQNMSGQKDIQRRTAICHALPYGIKRREYARELYETANKWKVRAAWFLYASGLLMDSGDDGRADDVLEDFEQWPWDLKLLQHLDDLKHADGMQGWPRPTTNEETKS